MKYPRAVLMAMSGLSHQPYGQEGVQSSAVMSESGIPLDESTKRNIAQALWLTEYDEKTISDTLLMKIKSVKTATLRSPNASGNAWKE